MAATTKQDLDFLDRFEPDVFWQNHGRKILWVIGALGLIGILAVYQQNQTTKREAEAASRLSQANDPAAWQAIAKDYPDKPIGAQALLRLGDWQFEKGQLAEATATYAAILAQFPNNPLADSARLSSVAILEAQGNFETAKVQYLQLATRQNSHLAVVAKIGAARCAEALHQPQEAQQLYEELVPATRGTAWEGIVFIRRAVLLRTIQPTPPSPETPPSLPLNP